MNTQVTYAMLLGACLLPSYVVAAPTLSVVRDGFDWTVYVTPDPALLAAGQGAMALELSLEVHEPIALVGAPVVDPLWNEEIDGVLIENPGNNPYAGAVTDGIVVHSGVPSQLGRPYTVNSIFASLGSTLFDSGGAKPVFTFSTTGAHCTLFYSGILAQDGDGDLFDVAGQVRYQGWGIVVDPNLDGAITGADIGVVSSNFGNVGHLDCFLPGDANGDGAVTGADIGVIAANFGNVLPSSLSVGAPVPEPKTILAATLLVGLVGYRRVRHTPPCFS
jgi:hypothetical protein